MNKEPTTVYILQETSEDDVPQAHVYAKADDCAAHALDLIEYGSLTLYDVEEPDLDKWNGEEMDFCDSEGVVLVRIYSTKLK